LTLNALARFSTPTACSTSDIDHPWKIDDRPNYPVSARADSDSSDHAEHFAPSDESIAASPLLELPEIEAYKLSPSYAAKEAWQTHPGLHEHLVSATWR
jgi:hypothetical protein